MAGIPLFRISRRGARWLVSLGVVVLALAALTSIYAPYLKALTMAATAKSPPTVYPMPDHLAPGMTAVDDWFVVAPIDKSTYAIGEPRYGGCNFAYLLLGDHHALLWDSGPGVRDISRVVARLTTLPVTAIPSHVHFDHVGGLKYFSDVALPHLADLRSRTVGEMLQLHRFEYLGLIEGQTAPAIRVTRWIEPNSVIDLGNRTVRVLPAPGHTDTSIVLLDALSGNMFTGDSIYPGHVWAFLPGTDLHAFRRTVIDLQSQTRASSRLFGGHGCIASETSLHVPSLGADAWQSLHVALDRALLPSATIGLPRTITSGPPITLDSKASWMEK